MVLAALAMDLERGLFLVEGKGDGDGLVLVVSLAIVARNDNARVANLHFGPVICSEGVNAKQSFASIVGKNGEKFLHKCRRGGGSAGPDKVSVGPYSESIITEERLPTEQGRQRTPWEALCHRRSSTSSERPCFQRKRCPSWPGHP